MAQGGLDCNEPSVNIGVTPIVQIPNTPNIEGTSNTFTSGSSATTARTAVSSALYRSGSMSERFALIAEAVLAELGDFAGINVPPPDVEIDIPGNPTFGINAGQPPTEPSVVMPDTNDIPTMRGDIQDIAIEDIPVPLLVLPDAPTDTMVWEEIPYVSTLLDNLQRVVEDVVVSGGTGINEEYEDILRDRALKQEELQHELRYNEAEHYYASKGHSAPPGALIARLDMINREKARADTMVQDGITAKLYELARSHGEFMTDIGARLENLTIDQKDKINSRALDAAKAFVAIIYDAYNQKLAGAKLKMDLYVSQWSAQETKVKAIAANNESIVSTYEAELKAFTIKLEAEFGIVEQIVKVYIAQLSGYESLIKSEVAKLDAEVKSYVTRLDVEKTKGILSIDEYKALVAAATAEIELRLGSQKETGRIASQIAASALSAFNASASISDSISDNSSTSDSTSNTISSSFSQAITNSLSEQLSLSNSGSSSCNINDTTSTNYSYTLSEEA